MLGAAGESGADSQYGNSDRIEELRWDGSVGGQNKCVLRWSVVEVGDRELIPQLLSVLAFARSGGVVLEGGSSQRSCLMLDSLQPDSCDEGSGTGVGSGSTSRTVGRGPGLQGKQIPRSVS